MAKRWRIESAYSNKITQVEVLKETAVFVTWVTTWCGKRSEQRSKKTGEFFPTWKAAHDHLLQRAEQKVKYATEELARTKINLEVISNMEAPKEVSLDSGE